MDKFILVVITLLTYVFSLYIAPFHIGGDQVHYTKAYNAVFGFGLIEGFYEYKKIIFTNEIGHYTFIWLFSNLGFDKNNVMALSNSVLIFLFYKFSRSLGFSPFLSLLLSFNYYNFALFFTLERLKFAFIVLFFGYIYRVKVLIYMSIFFHAMLIIPIFLLYASQRSVMRYKFSNIFCTKMVLIFFISTISWWILGQHIVDKVMSWYASRSFWNFDYWQIILIIFIGIFFVNKRFPYILYQLGLLFIAIFLGGSRINFLSIFGYLYFLNKKSNFAIYSTYILAIYLLYKSYNYMNMLILYGG
jgi:hypothetical protein